MALFGFRTRQLSYDLSESLLVRPAAWLVLYIALALLLPYLERSGYLDGRMFAVEPGTAQVVLGTVAGATMTVVSVVYSILLVALSLASMQFSTRILAGFTRDPVNQNTLGLFVGTFVYSLMVLRAVRTDPPWAPGIAVFGALVLSVTSLAAMVFFIHHIVRSIQANHLIARIADETMGVVDAVFGPPWPPDAPPEAQEPAPIPAGAVPVNALRSGYIQLIDRDALLALVRPGLHLRLVRGMGQFVTAGAPLAWLSPGSAVTDDVTHRLAGALDLGPQRTMQDDAEFGVRQIVDIALKALSPAVNDPSTAATCVDHLGRILVHVAGRQGPPSAWTSGAGSLFVPTTSFASLVELAADQLRQYARNDMAVTLRLTRMLGDVAAVAPHPSCRGAIHTQLRLIEASIPSSFLPEERIELAARLAAAHAACGGPTPPPA